MNENKVTLVAVFVFVCLFCNLAASEEIKWPAHVLKNIYIPSTAKDIRHSSLEGLYTLSYSANICYPAKNMIRDMAVLMQSQGWDRLSNDPLNPRVVTAPDYPDNDRSWGGYYPWDSYWKDSSGNVIRYKFSYEVTNTSSPSEYFKSVERSCSLKAVVVYFTLNAYQEMLTQGNH